MIRACTEITCGCSSPDCYQVEKQGDFFVFINEDTNQQFIVAIETFSSGLTSKSLAINGQNLSQNAIAKLAKIFGGS